MLVSKIKPCMSKYKHVCTVKLQMAHYNSYSLFDIDHYTDNRSNLGLIRDKIPRLRGSAY